MLCLPNPLTSSNLETPSDGETKEEADINVDGRGTTAASIFGPGYRKPAPPPSGYYLDHSDSKLHARRGVSSTEGCEDLARFLAHFSIPALTRPALSGNISGSSSSTSTSPTPKHLESHPTTSRHASTIMATIAAPAQAAAAAPGQIPVRLTTRSSKHAIPEAKYMIPSDWRRYQLSELINKVLNYGALLPRQSRHSAAAY